MAEQWYTRPGRKGYLEIVTHDGIIGRIVGAITPEYADDVLAALAASQRPEQAGEVERLRFRVIQLENEIVANLQGDLAILAESENLDADELRRETFARYEAAVDRWQALDKDGAALAQPDGARRSRSHDH